MATEFAYDIELSKDKKTLVLTVELPERDLARDPILECTDANALDIIRRDGFGNFKMTRTCGHLTNWVSRDGKGGDRSGAYTFSKIEKPTTAKKKTTTKKTTTTKTTTS